MNGFKETILGTWGLAGAAFRHDHVPTGYGHVEETVFMEVLSAAWDAGIRKIDTSPMYGNGNGFKRLQQWQQQTNHQFSIILKAGRKPGKDGMKSVLGLKSLEKEIDEQLNFFPHAAAILIKDPPISLLQSKKIFRLIEFLRKKYPALMPGIATHFPLSCELLTQVETPFIFQAEFNGINYHAVAPFYSKLKALGIQVQGMQPLHYGFLAKRQHAFAKDDWRSLISHEQQALLSQMANSFHDNFLPGSGLAPAVKAALFCYRFNGLSAVVIGPKSVEQLQDFLMARDLAAKENIGVALV